MPVTSTWKEKEEQRLRANKARNYVTEPSRGLKQRYAERKKQDEEFAKLMGVSKTYGGLP